MDLDFKMKLLKIFNFLSVKKSHLLFRAKGTVFSKIWLEFILGVLFTTGVVVLHNFVPDAKMEFKPLLVPILGASLGLLVGFRTNTAYDRYYEGRRIWCVMIHHIRILTRCIWLGVKEDFEDEAETQTTKSKSLIEKTTVINLLLAFVYATKNYLREEYSYDADPEIFELTSHFRNVYGGKENRDANLPKYFANGSTNQPPEEPKCKSISINAPDTNNSNSCCKTAVKKKKQCYVEAYAFHTPTNIPLELAYFLSSYIYNLGKKELTDSTTIGAMNTSVNNLMECLSQFEKILTTPIPLAYSVHLHQAVWIYILTLPFQLVNDLGWFTIPAIGFVIFVLLGILAVGWEIENPFGYDDNDLPLDDYCQVIRQEIGVIISRKYPDPDAWTFNPDNRPFFPTSFENTMQLQQKSEEEIRKLLSTFANAPHS